MEQEKDLINSTPKNEDLLNQTDASKKDIDNQNLDCQSTDKQIEPQKQVDDNVTNSLAEQNSNIALSYEQDLAKNIEDVEQPQSPKNPEVEDVQKVESEIPPQNVANAEHNDKLKNPSVGKMANMFVDILAKYFLTYQYFLP